jgi:flagellar biosynthesis GTPase FlhF
VSLALLLLFVTYRHQDNYQGEESHIIIISLVRSNAARDIGFMFSPERLNVLLSRARDACIIIGNADTFRGSRKGGELWKKFFNFITDRGHFYDGLPIFCERHPDRNAILKTPRDFEELSPDGGCQQAWCVPSFSSITRLPYPHSGVTLNCGAHQCPFRCHNLTDHSKVRCEKPLKHTCPNGHKLGYKCADGPPATCKPCDKEARKEAERLKREFEQQQERERQEHEHERAIAELERQIELERQAIRDEGLRHDRENALRNKMEELENARRRRLAQERAAQPVAPASVSTSTPVASHNSPTSQGLAATMVPDGSTMPVPATQPLLSSVPPPTPSFQPQAPGASLTPSSPLVSQTPYASTAASAAPRRSTTMQPTDSVLATPLPDSPSHLKWERQKLLDSASNKHIDALMAMTGLETVKEKVLGIRDQIEISKRQGKSMADDRFNISLLGNPGSGKTTVARLYAQFLASIDLIPGDAFVETTGSLLSNEGISGAKKHVDFVLKQGGGAIFIDEAYQLVSEKNYGGGQVLDFLLAEMENNVGKIIFILAGYNKEMEKCAD